MADRTALVIPQPQHSTPKIFLNKQIECCPSNQSTGTQNKNTGNTDIPQNKLADIDIACSLLSIGKVSCMNYMMDMKNMKEH